MKSTINKFAHLKNAEYYPTFVCENMCAQDKVIKVLFPIANVYIYSCE